MLKKLFLAAVFLALVGSGCFPVFSVPPKQNDTPAVTEPVWTEVGLGAYRYDCAATICGGRLIIYRFNKDLFRWRFEDRQTPATVESWAKSLPKAAFVINGVYFDEKWRPTGMLKTADKTINDRNYDLEKSALLELSPTVAIIDTSATKINASKMTEAGQSFPLLIKNGSPVPEFKDTHAARRTFIGTDSSGDIYVGVVPEDAITFVDLAKLLAKTEVKWNNVLNLDGGTSTGFAARIGNWSETMNSIVQVPNVIVVERQ